MQPDKRPDETRLLYILQQHLAGTLTSNEQTELNAWVEASPNNRKLLADMSDVDLRDKALQRQRSFDTEAALRKVKNQIRPNAPGKSLWYRYAAIAATIILITTVSILFYKQNSTSRFDEKPELAGDIKPGQQGATLILANGTKIRLTAAVNGKVANEAGVNITKTANGNLIYTIAGHANQKHTNTLSTANGETYQVHLPDGSDVWLNAASSLTYATNFAGEKERRVKLVGEAYFEIAKDKAHPFVVESRGQQVKVLGTHFNINSYANEPSTRTTLLEGSVIINSGKAGTVRLVPGQEAISDGQRLLVKATNIQKAVAWKDGYFRFYDEKIESIMRKLSRWYNIEISYEGALPQDEFNGRISRYKNISQVLRQLEKTEGVHFKIEGRRVTVSK